MANKIPRVPVREQDPKVRATNFEEVCYGYDLEEAALEASRCLQCKNPRCVAACPVNIRIPDFIGALHRGELQQAADIIAEDSSLPSICGRVCPQESQCEGSCILGIKSEPVAIGKLERFVGDWKLEHGAAASRTAPRNGRRVAVIGSGPAGYTAAIYTSRANLNPVLYEGIEPGGQLTTTTEIDNYPGYPEGIDGNQLMGHMRKQAERFGADIRRGTVTRADLSSRPFHLVVDGEKQIEADSLIIATGASARYLGLPSETKYRGQGVSACATCDGFFYRKKDVAVVGGGDTACEEATYLASICRQVYMIVRKPYLRASKAMQHRVMNTPNIEVLFEYNTAEVLGDDTGVTGVTIRHNDGKERTLAVAGFFVAIGHHPNTELFRNQLELDAEGYIRTEGNSSKTSVEGVFAAGDVQDPAYRQAITAAGSGCIAALDCERFLLQ